MIVTCPKCQTKFRLRGGAIGPRGTTVRCSRCGSIFRAALAGARGLRRPGPPPGVSDEDYILHGGPARAPLAPEAPPEVEAPPVSGPPEPAAAEAEPGEAKPAPAAAETRPEPEPETRQAPPLPEAPPPPEAEPPEVSAGPEPETKAPPPPEAEPPEPPEVSAGPEPEPATEAEPFPEPPPEPAPPDVFAPAAPGLEPEAEAAGQEALEEPWPEPQQAAVGPAGPLPPPGPTPTAQAPSRLSTWQATLRRRSVLVAVAAAALVVSGLLIYGSGIIGGGSADPKGTRQITFTGISGYFLKNDHDGVIYVIQGLARNGYKDRRGQIRIKAALYDGAGEAVQEQLVYAGNIFSREDLQRTPLKEITASLTAPVEEGSRSVVRPGATAPFMAVFGNLPKSLGEFSLEATSSSRVASS